MSIDWGGTDAAVAAAVRARGVETDLVDAALAAHARAAVAEIAARGLGPDAAIELRVDGWGQRYIQLIPPAASVSAVTVDGTSLDEDDDGYRLRPGGHFLERLEGGYASTWSGPVHITYANAAADDRYDRVVVDLIKLELQYSGLDSRRDGDYSEEAAGARTGGQKGYQQQREDIISELVPAGLGFA